MRDLSIELLSMPQPEGSGRKGACPPAPHPWYMLLRSAPSPLEQKEAVMRWFAPLIVPLLFIPESHAPAQFDRSVPSGDFRVEGRPGTAPTVGPSGGPSLPPGPASFRDSFSGRSPDEILRSIDKDLGKSSLDRPDSGPAGRSLDLERELRSPADKIFK
jgi:hypothetical protein